MSSRPGPQLASRSIAPEGAEQWRFRLGSGSRSCSGSRCLFRSRSGTSVGGGRTDTPGSHGGSRGVTPTLARTLDSDRLDRAQMMRGGLVTDLTARSVTLGSTVAAAAASAVLGRRRSSGGGLPEGVRFCLWGCCWSVGFLGSGLRVGFGAWGRFAFVVVWFRGGGCVVRGGCGGFCLVLLWFVWSLWWGGRLCCFCCCACCLVCALRAAARWVVRAALRRRSLFFCCRCARLGRFVCGSWVIGFRCSTGARLGCVFWVELVRVRWGGWLVLFFVGLSALVWSFLVASFPVATARRCSLTRATAGFLRCRLRASFAGACARCGALRGWAVWALLTYGLPSASLPTLYNNNIQIVQARASP